MGRAAQPGDDSGAGRRAIAAPRSFWLRAALALCVLFWAAVAHRLARYPAPHVGFNVLWLAPLFALLAAVGARKRHWPLTVVALLSVALSIAAYELDVLVPYELWLERGMPPRPF